MVMFMKNTRAFLKNCLFSVIAIGLGFIFSLIILEVILQFLPVNQPFRAPEPITVDAPILKFKKNGEFTFSRGWDFALTNTVRTNNYGFVNDQDYSTDDPRPLLAIVGDSYVEAAMVPYPDTLQGRLARIAPTDLRVYSFGASGSPLSQYLAYADYARQLFHPQAYTFVIIGNDFDESMSAYKMAPGFHYFFPKDNDYELKLVEFRPVHKTILHTAANRLNMGKLALVRYLRTNMPQLEFQISRLLSQNKQTYVGQTASSMSAQRQTLSKRAIDLFLARVEQACGLPRSEITFIVDGIRPEVYRPSSLESVDNSYWPQMRSYFMRQAKNLGYEVVDLNPIFVSDFKKRNQRFEFPTDAHWNGNGHGVAARAMQETNLFMRLSSPNKNTEK